MCPNCLVVDCFLPRCKLSLPYFGAIRAEYGVLCLLFLFDVQWGLRLWLVPRLSAFCGDVGCYFRDLFTDLTAMSRPTVSRDVYSLALRRDRTPTDDAVACEISSQVDP